MTRNFNLPPGCTDADISSKDECPRCGGSGEVEKLHKDPDGHEHLVYIPCSMCAGLGVLNLRALQP